MAKTIVIGDVHGLETWKSFVRWTYRSKVVFLGDYCDPYQSVDDNKVVDNLLKIIAYKRRHPSRVVLLLGNHDMHYLVPELMTCSRYNAYISQTLHAIFMENRSLFQYAYQDGNRIFTHAGISRGWWEECFHGDTSQNIAEQLNCIDDTKLPILAQCGWARRGTSPYGGIFWADSSEMEDPLPGFHQIVGHTRHSHVEHLVIDDNTKVTFCDCLHNGMVYKV